MLKIAVLALLSWAMISCAMPSCALQAQEITLYSEFERFNPFGRPVAQDRDLSPREIVSPAIPRNGHLSLHVVVTAPAGTNYFLYLSTNPPDTLRLTLYREHFVRCGDDYCPDWLTEIKSPSFGAMPESARDMPDQNTRCYLLDIFAPADVPPRRVRVEALLKTAIWAVAPMEVRVVGAMVPEIHADVREDIAPVEEPSSATAQRQLSRFMAGLPAEIPRGMIRLRDIVQRNAAEDMSIAAAGKMRVPELNLLQWWPFSAPSSGAEWYLAVRDFIYRFGP